MRLCGVGMTLEGAGGLKSPPAAYIEIDDAEGAVLKLLYPKSVIEVADPVAAAWAASEEAARAQSQAELAASMTVEPVADAATATTESASAPSDAAPASDRAPAAGVTASAADATELAEDGGDDSHADHNGQHATDLMDAFDLLEPGDFVTTGDRTGKPKVSALKDILDRDVTAEEIDAAWATKQAA